MPDEEFVCWFGNPEPMIGSPMPGYEGPHHCPDCAAYVEEGIREVDECSRRTPETLHLGLSGVA